MRKQNKNTKVIVFMEYAHAQGRTTAQSNRY